MGIPEILGKYKNNAFNIAIIVFSLFMANHINGVQSKINAELNEKIKTETERNVILADISRSEAVFNNLKKLINKKDLNSIINDIHTMARESSVSVGSTKPQNEKAFSDYIKYPYDMTVTGTYHRISRFISKLESSPNIYLVEYLSMQPIIDKKDTAQILSVDLRIVTVKMKE